MTFFNVTLFKKKTVYQEKGFVIMRRQTSFKITERKRTVMQHKMKVITSQRNKMT